jgi:phosphoribosylaminoimidazolecarboxamide formyltransferase/IMP cyclohydrolase
MNRLESVRLAVGAARASGFETAGSVLASDAFFPFADGVEEACAAGVRVIVQPGGSIRDGEVVRAAEGAGATMLFTGRRHFRH